MTYPYYFMDFTLQTANYNSKTSTFVSQKNQESRLLPVTLPNANQNSFTDGFISKFVIVIIQRSKKT